MSFDSWRARGFRVELIDEEYHVDRPDGRQVEGKICDSVEDVEACIAAWNYGVTMEWGKINAGNGVINYANGPYRLETAPMGTIGTDKEFPMWCATITKDGHIGSVEVWGVGSEQEIIVLCEKAAQATGLLP